MRSSTCAPSAGTTSVLPAPSSGFRLWRTGAPRDLCHRAHRPTDGVLYGPWLMAGEVPWIPNGGGTSGAAPLLMFGKRLLSYSDGGWTKHGGRTVPLESTGSLRPVPVVPL